MRGIGGTLLLATFVCASALKKVSVAAAKKQILAAIETKEYAGLKVVQLLETGFVPIQTKEFLDLAVGGSWRLAYSDFPLQPDPNIALDMVQTVIPEDGHLETTVEWDVRTTPNMRGNFTMRSNYAVNSKGCIQCSDVDHTLMPEKDEYGEIEVLLKALFRSIPPEVIDPTKLELRTSYVDPTMRITRVSGARFPNGILNIFFRVPSPSPSPINILLQELGIIYPKEDALGGRMKSE